LSDRNKDDEDHHHHHYCQSIRPEHRPRILIANARTVLLLPLLLLLHTFCETNLLHR